MRLSALLPYLMILGLGRMLGGFYYRLSPKRREIARINLQQCFPDQDRGWHEAMLKAHFASMGMSVLEVPVAWWGSEKKIAKLGHVKGIEYLQQAVAQGKGVLLFLSHTACTEMIGRIVEQYTPLEAMYRPSNHPVMEKVITAQRRTRLGEVIPHKNVKLMIRRLRKGKVVAYLADQNVSRKDGVFVNFFGILTATTPATSRLSKMTGAAVVPLKAQRRVDGKGYDLALYPALENFPTDDLTADTQRTSDLIEEWVREMPAQYYWIHRRFKTRPSADDPSFYP